MGTSLIATVQAASPDASLAHATWGLFCVTAALAIATFAGLGWSIWDSKLSAKAERQRERSREREELLERYVSRFNSPPILIARAELAKQNLGAEQTSPSGIEREPGPPGFRFKHEIPPQAFSIADFLTRLANQWSEDSFELDSLDNSFSDYVLMFSKEYEALLQRGDVAVKYKALNDLVALFEKRHEHTSTTVGVDPLSAGYDVARRQFWYSEYKLFRLFPSELPSLPKPSDAKKPS